MHNIEYVAEKGDLSLTIEPDLEEVGAYLRVYLGTKDVADHLQDSVGKCMEFALEEYDIPIESWQERTKV